MSEKEATSTSSGDNTVTGNTAKLTGLFAHKVGMSSVYTEEGEMVPVTVLKMEPWVVSQIKTVEKDGYTAIQLASRAKKAVNTLASERGHLKKAGFENGAQFVREIRQDIPAGLEIGHRVDIGSLAKGDTVQVTSQSKGRGFAGSVKRHGFAGGPAAHGSKFHRQPGSSGNRTWPGRVMPGKRFPGHLGDDQVTVRNVKVIDVLPEEGVLMVKGPVPGSRNTLVRLMKE